MDFLDLNGTSVLYYVSLFIPMVPILKLSLTRTQEDDMGCFSGMGS